MRGKSKTFLAVGLVTILFAGSLPANAQGPADVIGIFERFTMEEDLTEDRIQENAQGFKLDAPAFASEMRVEKAYLDDRLPGWASNKAFELAGGHVVFGGEDVKFTEFVLDETPRFTLGRDDVLKFGSRPMWVSAEEIDEGLKIVMDDGDTAGQSISIAQAWLWSQGISKLTITHEDGEELDVTFSEGRYTFQMPHFSWVILTPLDITVLGRSDGGVPVQHTGTVQFNSAIDQLNINVGLQTSSYDLMVEKEWFDVNVPHPSIQQYKFRYEEYQGAGYYVVPLVPAQTPTTVEFKAFVPGPTAAWTYGDPATIALRAFNLSVFLQGGTVKISAISNSTGVTIDLVGGGIARDLKVNLTYLESVGINKPHARLASNYSYAFSEQNLERTHLLLPRVVQAVFVLGGSLVTVVENRTLTGSILYNNTSRVFEVGIPLFVGYLQYGFALHAANLPWNDPGLGYELTSVSLVANGVTVGSRNSTHYVDGTRAVGPDAYFNVPWPGTPLTQLDLLLHSPDGSEEDTFYFVDWDDLFINNPFLAGVEFNGSGCWTEVAGLKVPGAASNGESYSEDEVDWGGAGRGMLRIYWKKCDDGYEGPSNTAHHGFGVAARAKTLVHGEGTWTTWIGAPMNGAFEAATSQSMYHSVTTKEPRMVMEIPEVQSGLGSAAFQAVAVQAELRREECPSTGTQNAYDAIFMALTLIDGIGNVIQWLAPPHLSCTATVEEIAYQDPDDPTWQGHGAAFSFASNGLPSPVGFWALWALEAPPDSETIFRTSVATGLTISEGYHACLGESACGPYTAAHDWFVRSPDDMYFKLTRGGLIN